jgi:radical SAM protein with 4Fe4S-binding SPASM domain
VRAASDDIALVARMTVAGDRPSLLENVRGLWRENVFDWFQIFPAAPSSPSAGLVTLGARGARPPEPQLPPAFLPQLVELLSSYESLFAPGNRFRGVLEYERLVDMIVNGKMALAYCSGGRSYYTFSPDDSIMPCHRLVGDLRFRAGQAGLGLEQPLDAWRTGVDAHPVCSECWARYCCGGGCKQENLMATGDVRAPGAAVCAYQLTLVEHVARMLSRQGPEYRARDRRPLDDLFVSCGRPVIATHRSDAEPDAGALQHFRLA